MLYVWQVGNVVPTISFRVRSIYFDYFFSPKGNFLAILVEECPNSYVSKIYSLPACKYVQTLRSDLAPDFSPDEKFLVMHMHTETGYYEEDSKLFHLNGQYYKEVKTPHDCKDIQFSKPSSCNNYKIALIYKSNSLPINNDLAIFSLKTGEFEKEYYTSSADRIEFVPNSNFLKIKCFYDLPNKVLDIDTKKTIVEFDDTIEFLANGILYVKEDKKNDRLQVFEKNNQNEVITFKNIMEFKIQGRFLVVLSKNGTLNIWHTETREISATADNVTYFEFLGCDNVIRIGFKNSTNKIFRYVPPAPATPFNIKNYKNTDQQKNIQNFFSGQNPKNVKYSDINVLFKKVK